MDDRQCKLVQEHFKELIERNETRLNDHSKRIDLLEQSDSRTLAKIEHLADKIDGLVTTLRWFIGLLLGGTVTFFFYAVQHGAFR